jgi:hypothetical protein
VGKKVAVIILASNGHLVRTEPAIVTDGAMVADSLVVLAPGIYVCLVTAGAMHTTAPAVHVN